MDQYSSLGGNVIELMCLFAESGDGSITVGDKEARI